MGAVAVIPGEPALDAVEMYLGGGICWRGRWHEWFWLRLAEMEMLVSSKWRHLTPEVWRSDRTSALEE